jgi:hypothetical protein
MKKIYLFLSLLLVLSLSCKALTPEAAEVSPTVLPETTEADWGYR